ncbi:MAG: hypothetical protein AAF532_10250 [Planctomycetota bacterium]
MSSHRVLSGLFLCSAALWLASAAEHAEARPGYLRQFAKTYDGLAAEAKSEKCNVCHYGRSKKDMNDYGSAMKATLTKKNERKAEEIEKALKLIEDKESSVEGKTFGMLIADGTLPGTAPE